MKTIIAGGRDYRMTFGDLLHLDAYRRSLPITEVVSGAASGADACGENWARSRGVAIRWFMADWSTHGKAAGPIRNQQMADYADALIAFPGGRGTADMIRRAEKRGLKVIRL